MKTPDDPHDPDERRPTEIFIFLSMKEVLPHSEGVAARAPTPKTAANIANSAVALPGLIELTCVLNPA